MKYNGIMHLNFIKKAEQELLKKGLLFHLYY